MTAVWTPHLEVAVTAPFLPGSPDTQPTVEARTSGLRIDAQNVVERDGVLSFRLLLAFSLASPLARAYLEPARAVEIVFERPDTAQSSRLPLLDPFNEYGPVAGKNYRGDPSPGEKVTSYQGQSVGIEIAVPLPDRGRGPHVYVTAFLRDMASNTLALDVDTAAVTSVEMG